MPCKPNIHPANSIRHAYSRYKHVRANTIGIVMVSPYWLKFAALRLFVETIPGTPTKRPVTKRPVTKRPVTKRPVTKGPDYQTSRLPNVQLPKVQITKRPVYQTSSYQTSSYRTSILVIITKHPFFILIIFFNKMCQKYQVCIPI
jgi:hypothetical protein